jgi:hypothetical protein
MKQQVLTALIVLALLTSVASLAPADSATVSQDEAVPLLSMPIEHINYTITEINGSLWATIDGEYPIYLINPTTCNELPMVYPMPPNTTNIHVYLNDRELGWMNYTQANPGALHQTAIGDWWLISSVLGNLSGSFILRIHYQHPLETVNSSYLFLYDLNISPYLSAESASSTAYFTVRLETNITDVHAYTALPASSMSEWKPKNFTTTTQGNETVLAIQMDSDYDTLGHDGLPGDLVVKLSNGTLVGPSAASGSLDPSAWIIPVLIDVALLLVLLYAKRRTISSAFSSRKKST